MKKLFLVLMLIASGQMFAAPSASEEVRTRLNAIKSMTASFNQVVKADHREVSNTYGTMALERPGRFRWQTKSPLEQLVVADSHKLWVYDVDLEQVTVKKQGKGLGGTPGLFLSANSDTVTRDFNVSKLNKPNVNAFELQAKSSKDNFQRVILTFKKDKLTLIEFYDQLGQHTILKLSRIKNNPKLDSSLFKFKPPKGVDVVDQ